MGASMETAKVEACPMRVQRDKNNDQRFDRRVVFAKFCKAVIGTIHHEVLGNILGVKHEPMQRCQNSRDNRP